MVNDLDDVVTDHEKKVSELISNDNEPDGVIFVERSGKADYRMNYFNKDGSGNSLCGNGLRCTMKFILDNNISANNEIEIEAVSKIYKCRKNENGLISVTFPPPENIRINFPLKVHFEKWWEELNCSFINTGSPHIVVFIDDINNPKINSLDEIKINEWGRNIRMHKDLMPEGANVNFVKKLSGGNYEIRSYERGVEGETLACGTGVIAAAVISNLLGDKKLPLKMLTRSGEYLETEIKINEGKISEVILTGKAERI